MNVFPPDDLEMEQGLVAFRERVMAVPPTLPAPFREEYRPDPSRPPCVLCGWPETLSFHGSTVCVRCRSQLMGPTFAPVVRDGLGQFFTASAPNPGHVDRAPHKVFEL